MKIKLLFIFSIIYLLVGCQSKADKEREAKEIDRYWDSIHKMDDSLKIISDSLSKIEAKKKAIEKQKEKEKYIKVINFESKSTSYLKDYFVITLKNNSNLTINSIKFGGSNSTNYGNGLMHDGTRYIDCCEEIVQTNILPNSTANVVVFFESNAVSEVSIMVLHFVDDTSVYLENYSCN